MIVREDLWKNPGFPGMIVVTTNSLVNRAGGLIMGRGSAGEARDRIPGIQAECARILQDLGLKLDGTEDYGFEVIRPCRPEKLGFGIFQAKRDWQDVSRIDTLLKSFDSLAAWALAHPDVQIRCPVPGLGCGRIGRGVPVPEATVFALCTNMPGNITWCRK